MLAVYCAMRSSARCQSPPAESCVNESLSFATMMRRGPILTVRGFSTPSSTPSHMPDTASSLLSLSSSRNLFSSRASGNASNIGPMA